MDDESLSLVSIDAEAPLSEVVQIAALDIARRRQLFDNAAPMPLEAKDVQALCSWGALLNSVAKDHAKLFEDRLKKLGLGDIDKHLGAHPVVAQAKAVAEAKRTKR